MEKIQKHQKAKTMVELIIERQPQESQVYFKERGGICRILQLGCLASVEGCLGFELYEEPGKVLVQVILAIIPLVTIICLLAAHILFGPHEFWPTLQRFSWHKLEGIHDFTAFMLLLPSAVTLFIPPCTKFETSAGVLTLVALFLVTLQGIENLCRTQKRPNPIVSARYLNNESISLMNKPQGPYRVSLPYTVSHQCCTPLHENAVPRTVRRAQVLSTSPYTSSHRCSTPLCTNDLPQTVRTAQVLSASPCTSSHRCSTLLYTNAVSQTAKTGPVSSASPFTVSQRCSTPLYVNAVPQYVRTAKALSPKENESFAGKVQFMDFLFSPKVSPIDYGGVGRIQCDNVSHHNLLHARVDIQQELHDVSSYYNSYIEIRDSEQVQPPMDDIYYCSSISLPEINLRQKSMNSAFLDTSSPFDEKINGLSYEDHRVAKLSKQSPGIGVECREKRKVKENHPKALLINETCIAQSPSSTVDGDKKQNDENVANPILHDKSFITPTSLISSSDTLFNYDTGGTRLPILEMPDTLPDPSFSPIKISENFSACASNFPTSLKSVKFSKPNNFLGQSILPQPVPRTVKLYKEESFRDLSYPVPLPRRSLKLTSTNAFLPGNYFLVDNRFQSQKVCCRKTVSLS